ncbi:MAG: SDR family oxidoreductase [Actinomyces sp.]|nr:MAG: SDR family oxidoreductase [Actinomyces sp.]
MDLRLDGRTALVTGGSAGIGLGIARAYVEAGANVMIVSRKAERCEAAAAELRALEGGEVDWRTAHAGDVEGGAGVVADTLERFGSLDILVNNAATNPHAGPVIECPPSAFDKTYEVNLRGPLLWTQSAWRAWMHEHGGCVINIASVAAFKTSSLLGIYGVLKDALVHLTRQLAAELGPGVRVNAIAPAVVKTDFARLLWEGERGEQTARSYPLRRLGEPADVAAAALFLASDASAWMTGDCLVLDGGQLVRFAEET